MTAIDNNARADVGDTDLQELVVALQARVDALEAEKAGMQGAVRDMLTRVGIAPTVTLLAGIGMTCVAMQTLADLRAARRLTEIQDASSAELCGHKDPVSLLICDRPGEHDGQHRHIERIKRQTTLWENQ